MVGRTRLSRRRSQWSVALDSTEGAANGRSHSTQQKAQQMVGRTRLNRRRSQWSVVLDSTQGAAVQLKKIINEYASDCNPSSCRAGRCLRRNDIYRLGPATNFKNPCRAGRCLLKNCNDLQVWFRYCQTPLHLPLHRHWSYSKKRKSVPCLCLRS